MLDNYGYKYAITRAVNFLLLRKIFLILAIISSFLDIERSSRAWGEGVRLQRRLYPLYPFDPVAERLQISTTFI